MNLCEQFNVTNGVRQGGVLSPYLFAVYLDDLSLEINNIEAGCYVVEVLLNHLMLAEVYVDCKVYQMCVRLMQHRMKLFSTAALFV